MGCGASVEGGGAGGKAKLDLTGHTELPSDAFRRAGIRELVLRECRLFEIPTDVFELTGLVTLDVAENELSAISPLIANLSELQVRTGSPARARCLCLERRA